MRLAISSTVHPIEFSHLSGQEFERLVYATALRMHGWLTLDWHGQSGGDGGRDIVGTRQGDYGQTEHVVYACANWKSFSSRKGISDINKFTRDGSNIPTELVIVAGNSVSAAIKEKCQGHGKSKGISRVQVWSASELEEHLRFHAPSVLERFFSGVVLPDEPEALKAFVLSLGPTTDREAGELIVQLFRRPAFQTRISEESSLPAFDRAIGDCIGALNTGIWRDREGALIARIPSLHMLSNSAAKLGLERTVDALNTLRVTFDNGLRNGWIRPCGCGKPDCPTFMISPRYCSELEAARDRALLLASDALRHLGVRL
jgi:hypothetical protein